MTADTQPHQIRNLLVPAVMVAALGGALIAAQSSVNGSLTAFGAGALLTAWLSYVGTMLTAALVLVVRRRTRWAIDTCRTHGRWWWPWIGLFGVPLVIGMSFGVPIVGVAVASVASVAGQTISGLALDSRGIGLPAPLRLTGRRLLAAIVAVTGLAVAIGGGHGVNAWQVVGVGATIAVGGALIGVQQAGNGRINLVTDDAFLPTLTSSAGGTVLMTVIVGGAWVSGALDGARLAGADAWWLYLGGPLGCGITATSAWAIRHLGTFALTPSIVVGQLVAAVVIDLVTGGGVGALTYVSVVLSIAATLLVVVRRRARTP
jgi:transporter family-2 protein